jgi:hypothetical protein
MLLKFLGNSVVEKKIKSRRMILLAQRVVPPRRLMLRRTRRRETKLKKTLPRKVSLMPPEPEPNRLRQKS